MNSFAGSAIATPLTVNEGPVSDIFALHVKDAEATGTVVCLSLKTLASPLLVLDL